MTAAMGDTWWCTTKGGAVATHLHSGRRDPARLAWLDGFREGQEDAVLAMDSASQPWTQRYVQRIRDRIEARR